MNSWSLMVSCRKLFDMIVNVAFIIYDMFRVRSNLKQIQSFIVYVILQMFLLHC
jgi:hypothetical protein